MLHAATLEVCQSPWGTQLMELVPEMRLYADPSHFVVDRELRAPGPKIDQRYIHDVLERADRVQGRIATRERIHVPIGFPQHRERVETFKRWCRDGMRMWRQRNR